AVGRDRGGAPAGEKPGGDAGAPVHRRQVRRERGADIDLDGHGYGASGRASRPAVSASPKTRLKAWTPCPAAPFTRLSMTPSARIRPVRSSVLTNTRAWLLPRTWPVAGGASAAGT